jgi:hypothetical protein
MSASLNAFQETKTVQPLSPEIIEFDDFDPEWAANALPKQGVLLIKHVPVEMMARIAPAGSKPLLQYEGVFASLKDCTTLSIVAQDNPIIHTTAFKNKDTSPHMDGYQFPAEYKGLIIAGPGNMPDYEVLGYPFVGDERLLMFAGLLRAAAQLPNHYMSSLNSQSSELLTKNTR